MRLSEIRRFRRWGDDFASTRRLKQDLAELSRRRQPFYLTRADLEPILKWKLRTQYGRGAKVRRRLTDELVRQVTRQTFAYQAKDVDMELRERTRLLDRLPGVGVPVASAILALVEPRRYCVIDFRGWRALFGEERQHFSVGHYRRYRRVIAQYAKRLGWSIQETDAAVWALERHRSLIRRGRQSGSPGVCLS
jgi:hypothetical protein